MTSPGLRTPEIKQQHEQDATVNIETHIEHVILHLRAINILTATRQVSRDVKHGWVQTCAVHHA